MTSYGSQSALARDLGVHRRTLERWLKEGETGGVRGIPDYARGAIDTVFEVHRDVVIAQARADGIPSNYYRPIFLERKALRTGRPGDRVVGEYTQFIRSELRSEIMIDQQRSQRYISASVRSKIDLSRYFRLDAEGNVKDKYLKRTRKTPAQTAAANLQAFVNRERTEKGRVVVKAEPFPLYTRYEDISPLRKKSDTRGVRGIEEQLRQKHEPATGQPGTVAADQYLYQLIPAQYVEQQKAAKRKAAQQKAAKRPGASAAKKAARRTRR